MRSVAVVTNDSDLAEPIRVAEAELGVRVGVVNPHPAPRRSHTLEATFFKQLRPSTLGACQLPLTLHDATGSIHKPPSW